MQFSKRLLLSICLCTSALVYAQDIASNQLSYIFLQDIFGSVNGLMGGGDTILGKVFQIFNIAIAFIGGAFASITVIQGVAQTAFQGVLMGKRGIQSVYFTIFRTVSGLALVMPVYNGYSFLQYLVISLVLTSSDMASQISGKILASYSEYDQARVIADVMGTKEGSENNEQSYSNVVEAGYGGTAMSIYNKLAEVTYDSFKNKDEEVSGQPTVTYNYDENNKGNNSITIQPEGGGNPVTISKLDDLSELDIRNYRDNIHSITRYLIRYFEMEEIDLEATDTELQQAQLDWKTNLASKLFFLAKSYAVNFVVPIVFSNSDNVGLDYSYDWIKFPWLYQSVAAGASNLSSPEGIITSIGRPSAVGPTFRGLADVRIDYDPPELLQLDLSKSNSLIKSSDDLESSPTILKLSSDVKESLNHLRIKDPPEAGAVVNSFKVKDYWDKPPEIDYEGETSTFAEIDAIDKPLNAVMDETVDLWLDSFVKNTHKVIRNPALEVGKLCNQLSDSLMYFVLTISRDVVSNQMNIAYKTLWTFLAVQSTNKITTAISGYYQQKAWDEFYCLVPLAPQPSPRVVMCNPQMIPAAPAPLPNPAYFAQLIQNGIKIGVTTGIHIAATVAKSVSEGLMSVTWMVKTNTAADYQYFGYIIAGVSPIMVLTNLLSIWIPMLPSITYFVAILGWILAVGEAVVGIPLVALGLTFPQGQDLLGSAQQAGIMLLSVFIRAPLIVVGFYFGMLFLSVGLAMMLKMVVPILADSVSEADGTWGAIYVLSTLVFMVYISATLMTYCLSASYRVPNMVIRWVGGQVESNLDQQTIQRIYSMFNQQQASALASVQKSAMGAQQGGKSIAGSVG
ncbi:hypothetical protein MMH89_04180 [Candidatus Comchoanobacter bicostacola]|uniref:DotA/TraY family protein n=1 Tax=Candidatus Comchoanobacter bicostacola TaxID=2919598 RepID=A0ABY5DKS8_9GAMM|nr:hypothetical protein [Candidatus Comchoanobacter bicostacola]UTC24415.1 hypothetical protein MMH89_04180 [Candidatus Comchoanobacter bicostacola]